MAKTKAGVSLTFQTQIDLSQETREEVIAILNQQLADTFDLYSQALSLIHISEPTRPY